MKWIIRCYALVLLAYTGWRTYDFMVQQLPAGDTSGILAILFLFTTEVGLALWHEISINHCSTKEQYYTAVGLTWIDFLGSLLAGLADMILRQTFYGSYEIPPILAYVLLYGLPAIVALNVAGVLFYLANESETQIDQAKKQLHFKVVKQAIKELNENSANIAEGLKKDIYRELRDDVTGKIEKEYLKAKTSQPAAKTSVLNDMSDANNGDASKMEPVKVGKNTNPTRR